MSERKRLVQMAILTSTLGVSCGRRNLEQDNTQQREIVSTPDECIGDQRTLFRDGDGDGYGSPGHWETVTIKSCGEPINKPGYRVVMDGDCDDRDPNIHRSKTELCNDQKDNNCNGKIDELNCHPIENIDDDRDGYSVEHDCQDGYSKIHPGTIEVSGDRLDNNCDGRIDEQSSTTTVPISDIPNAKKDDGITDAYFMQTATTPIPTTIP